MTTKSIHGWCRVIPAIACGLLLGAPARAQIPGIDDAYAEYLRVLQLLGRPVAGSFTVRPIPVSLPTDAGGGTHLWGARIPPESGPAQEPELTLLDPRVRASFNTGHPTGQNDGAVWQGKGLTTAVDFGGTFRWQALRLTVAPTAVFTQNARFRLGAVEVPGMPVYAYPWRRIDLPQRFGPKPLWTLDPGQSEISLGWKEARVGFGTRNLWWGPGMRNAIVMSDNAPGFPHAFLGTDGPAGVRVGSVEARWIWGWLTQSEWFDPAVAETDRFLTGVVLAYSPSFLDGLTVGATRVFYGWIPEGGLGVGDYFMVLRGVRKESFITPENPTGDDEQDQLLSVFFRWALPGAGFEVHAEWARNDHSGSYTDFIQEPEHSQAYTLGLQRALPLSRNRILTLWGELTHLERSRTLEVRESPVYYAHHIVTQGYTQRGQVVGAGLGPGGNGQQVGADLYSELGRVGIWLQRDVHDNDAYYDWAAANDGSFCCNDVSLRLGSRVTYFLGRFDVGGGALLTREMNRYFAPGTVWNLNVSLTAAWRPR